MYDKKSYRESKRRRRQAMRQSETGYIKPFRRGKKRIVIAAGAAVLICAAAVLLIFHPFAGQQTGDDGGPAAIGREERLRPVNRANPLKETYVPPLADFENVRVHAAISGELEAMRRAAEEKGVPFTVTRGYVSYAEQKQLYEENLAEFMKDASYTPVRAQAAAQAIVPEAGCSEAQTGLYVEFDVTDPRAKSFIERECIRYGFIQRYAENKEDLSSTMRVLAAKPG